MQTQLIPEQITCWIDARVREESEAVRQNKFIITGGPGSGKTSIIKKLREKGHFAADEAAAYIIGKALKEKISNTPWNEPWFETLVIQIMRKFYKEIALKINNFMTSFFDRGPIDPLIYLLRRNSQPNDYVIQVIEKSIKNSSYNKTVFLIDNLGFCKQESYRVENEEQSCAISRDLKTAYETLGYRIVHVPVFSDEDLDKAISKRADFILNQSRSILNES